MGLPEEDAYPAVLARQFAALGKPFQFANAGVSGDTSAGGLRRIDWVLKTQPEIVVVELGGNDGLRGGSLPDVDRNLRAILSKILAARACPILLGMELPPSHGPEYTKAFSELYPQIAVQLNVAWVPYFMKGVAGVPELNQEDGLHPTREGQARLAANLAPVFERALEGCARGKPEP